MMDRISYIFHSYTADILSPDRWPLAACAVVLCAVVGMVTGPMHGNANPFLWKLVNGIFGRIGRRLDRPQRPPADLAARGLFLTVLALAFALFISGLADDLAKRFYFWGVVEVIFLSLALSVGTVWFSLLRVYAALDKGGKISAGAYLNIARTTRTDLTRMDDFGITRVTMAMTARCFDKGVVAPLFWYLLFGLSGAYVYAFLAALAWRFGKDGQSRGFGSAILVLERLVGWVPTTISASLIASAGLFTPTGGMTRAFLALFKTKAARYDEGGPSVTAMAYALNVSLGGPVTDIDGSTIRRQWVGPDSATAKLDAGHLRRALYISLMAHLLLITTLLGAMVWAARFM